MGGKSHTVLMDIPAAFDAWPHVEDFLLGGSFLGDFSAGILSNKDFTTLMPFEFIA